MLSKLKIIISKTIFLLLFSIVVSRDGAPKLFSFNQSTFQAFYFFEKVLIDSSNFVLIGISAGALNTPAIYEALPVKPKCVALVAGGANLPEIVQKSTLTNWDFVVDGKFLTIEQRQTLSARYLDTFSRDPYHLSGLLSREKTLLLHAKWDKIVPAENGDLLWDRSGRPERWVYPSGHLGLFAISHDYARELVDWIQEKLQ